ncbi:hypothetical protein Tco_0366350 [Tanacetum coccineum]
MLAPISLIGGIACSTPRKSHGIRNLAMSPSFFGFKEVRDKFRHEHQGIVKLISKLKSLKDFINFSFWSLSFSWRHSSFPHDESGIECFRNWSNNRKQQQDQHWGSQYLDYETEFEQHEDGRLRLSVI